MPVQLPPNDYVSPGLPIVMPDAAFPDLIVGDTRITRWRWLRRWVEHNWYTSRYNPDVGFVTRDEAAILYNAARLVRGKPCLEIGCWRGWSTVHLALGSGMLDVVDPVLADPDFAVTIHRSCEAAGVVNSVIFHPGSSPAMVEALARTGAKRWSLVFVDGDHEGDAPCLDAEVAMRYAAETAIVLFHDLVSPYVAAGLGAMRNAGWRTMVYQTMQIMGVAWRGNIEPPDHVPDPNIFWTLPRHLDGYLVSNWKRPTILADGSRCPNLTMTDRRNAALIRAQSAEDAAVEADGRAQAAEARAQAADDDIHALKIDLNKLRDQLTQRNIQIAERSEQFSVQQAEVANHDAQMAFLGSQLVAQQSKLAYRDAQNAYLGTQLLRRQNELVDLGAQLLELQNEFATQHIVEFLTKRRVLFGLLRRRMSERFEVLHLYSAGLKIDHPLLDHLFGQLLRWRILFGLTRRPKSARKAIVERVVRDSLRNAQETRLERLLPFQHELGATMRAGVFPKTAEETGSTRLFELKREADVATKAVEVLRRTQEVISQSFPQMPRSTASGGSSFINHLLTAGWGPEAPPFPEFPGDLIRRCFLDSRLGDGAELAWVKRVISSSHVPTSGVALLAAAARVRSSGFFEAPFYRGKAGISAENIDLAIHYVLVGDALGVPPSPFFDPEYYGERNPDVVAVGSNRLLHYVSFGYNEGRRPLPPTIYQLGRRPIDNLKENIIVVVHETSRTGAPIVAWNIAERLAARYNVFTIALGGGALTEDFKALSVEMYGPFEHERRHPTDLEYGLKRLFDSHAFKYAIINSCESRPVIECCAKRLIPTLMLMHEFASYVPADSLRRAFDMASEIVFPAEIVAQSSFEVHPPLRDRCVRILPQGICAIPGREITVTTPMPPNVDALLRARKEGIFIVLGAGSVEFRKGVDIFLATAIAVRRKVGNRVRFVWVGRGYRPKEDLGYSVYLHEQLQRSGLPNNVTFFDEVSELETIYGLADVFFLCSRLDPMPNVSIDAAYRGIPLVCFENASGIAELLKSDPEAAFGVVNYLDPIAAGQAIVALATEPDRRIRVAESTKNLVRCALGMARYVEQIDALGTAASVRIQRDQDDADLLCHSDEFDQDLYLGPAPIFESRLQTVRRAVSQRTMNGNCNNRRTAPGFNPLVWRLERSERGFGDPLAEFVRAGRPSGSWFTPVLFPGVSSNKLEAPGIRSLLHVHLSDTNRIFKLRERLQINRLPFDLIVSTDAVSKADVLHEQLRFFDRGLLRVAVAETRTQSSLGWLLSELQQPSCNSYAIVGHLTDCSDDSFIDFQWTALLGGRQAMLDRILWAFSSQSILGLVFPCDPILPNSDIVYDHPSGGMFWARREVLHRLQGQDSTWRRNLPRACVASGLTQAVAHVPGIFV